MFETDVAREPPGIARRSKVRYEGDGVEDTEEILRSSVPA